MEIKNLYKVTNKSTKERRYILACSIFQALELAKQMDEYKFMFKDYVIKKFKG